MNRAKSETKPDLDTLLQIGFQEIGNWDSKGSTLEYVIGKHDNLMRMDKALYAFCCDQDVLYIGKTTKTLRQRFMGYCNPGPSQRTNRHKHEEIKQMLAQHKTVQILVFIENHCLEWGGCSINLPAGLEDSLIEAFQPAWNGIGISKAGESRFQTETEELEEVALDLPEEPKISTEIPNRIDFNVNLGTTYYEQGYINPGVSASEKLGEDNSPIIIYLGNMNNIVDSFINRRANQNGSVRIIGNNKRIAAWFRSNFNLHDSVQATILNEGEIFLRLPE